MLKFFHAPQPLKLEKQVRFPEIQLKGSTAANTQGFIPFSCIYMTSASQLGHFCRSINNDERIFVMSDKAGENMLSHQRCPVNIGFRKEGILRALKDSGLDQNDSINVVIVNGMGRGYGDNVAGLGALQHFHKAISDKFPGGVTIDLLQRNTGPQGMIYERYDEVNETRQLPITVTQFYRYDAYVDLTDLLSIERFHKLPLFDFFLQALSMQKKVRLKRSKHTRMNIDQEAVASLKKEALRRADLGFKKLVLLHPSASSPLRTMPVEIVDRIVNYILANSDALIVSCVPLASQESRVVNMSDLSTDIHAFFTIIAACDAVISVGTVTYHVSGSLQIPTLLIPTVNADVESAKNLASVTTHLPRAHKSKISQKHMSREAEDVEQVQPIWHSVDEKAIAGFLKKAL